MNQKYILYSKGLNVFYNKENKYVSNQNEGTELKSIGEAMKIASELNNELKSSVNEYFKIFPIK